MVVPLQISTPYASFNDPSSAYASSTYASSAYPTHPSPRRASPLLLRYLPNQ